MQTTEPTAADIVTTLVADGIDASPGYDPTEVVVRSNERRILLTRHFNRTDGGWEAVVEDEGRNEQDDLPDGPAADASTEDVLDWVKSFAVPETLYRVVRFYRDNTPREVIDTGLTLAEAQAHCQREDTHGEGWFDGYEAED